MPIEITMPKLTDTMTEATLAKWLKKEGDNVKPGDMIAEVETDKATQELEAFEAGTVARILIAEGAKTPVGALIVVLAKPGEDAKQVAAGVKSAAAPKPAAPIRVPPQAHAGAPAKTIESMPAPQDGNHEEGDETTQAGPASGGKVRVSPLARKIADEKGVNLSTLTGTGPEGRIIKRDVLDFLARPPAPDVKVGTVRPVGPSTAAQVVPTHLAVKLEQKNLALSNMRQTIARRLVQSKQTIPHFYLTIDVLMDKLLELRISVNEQLGGVGGGAGEKISVTDFVARACAMALTRVPVVNSSFAETAIIQHGTVDLGIAVALEDGLVVPVIRHAHAKSVRQLSQEIRQLADLGRGRRLKAEQMSGSTFTISNLGMFGVKQFAAIVNPPESAILAVGGTAWQPVVKEINGKREVVPAQVMTLTLSADHRVVDGATGARFLQELKAILEAPLTTLV